MRQVNETETRPVPLLNPLRRLRDPARGINASTRAPETTKWKPAEILFHRKTNVERRGVNVENLATVRGIHRTRSDRVIRGGIHVVPPEKLRAGEVRNLLAELFPEFSTPHETIRLLPEMDLCQAAIVPTI